MRVTRAAALVVVAAACGPDTSEVGTHDSGSSEAGDTSGTPVETTTTDESSSSALDTSGGATSEASESTTAAADESSTGAPQPEGPVCGDGRMEGDEGCDDGNDDDDDECDSDCVPTAAIRWTETYAGADGQADCATRVVAGPSDLVWVAGYVRNPAEEADGWVGQLDATGSWTWHSIFTGAGHDNDEARGLAVDASGEAYVGGSFTQNGEHVWLRRITPAGATVWTQTWSDGERGSEVAYDLALDASALRVTVERYDLSTPNLLQSWSLAGEVGESVVFDTPELAGLRIGDLDAALDGSVWAFGTRIDDDLPAVLRFDAGGAVVQVVEVATPTAGPFGLWSGVAGDIGATGAIALLSYDVPAGGEVPTLRVFTADGELQGAWLVELDGDPRAHALAIDAS
ncbi:MAG TPA: hypothetical protein VFG69_01945, partial [Nannocystaceae bacterium]|nr:hypothetical protein [Nannocystaceae bacterium]